MADNADRHVALGLQHLAARRLTEAEAEARSAIALRPDHADALHLSGIAAWQAGRREQAVELIARTVALAPGFADAQKNLGLVLLELGRRDEACVALRRAGELLPTLEALYPLATTLREAGDVDGAIALYRKILGLSPDHADTLNDLGGALKERGFFDEAIDLFRRAATLPNAVSARLNLAGTLMDLGRTAQAREEYARVLEMAPGRADARFGHCLAQIPIVYASEREIPVCRAAYAEELRKLQAHYRDATTAELAQAADAAVQHLPFYLAYQGENDRQLQEIFGGLLVRLMAARHPDLATRPTPLVPGSDGVIRVGVVSAFFRDHSVWKLFGGWVRGMDRRRFRLHGYSTGPRRDTETERARASFDDFVETSSSFENLARRIRADDLHVLIYPEIGMDATTARLAALRLAPLQCAAWGHPATSGLSTIDFFLSSELMEPEGGAAFYSEKLVQLPSLSINYQPLDIAPETPDLAALGVRPGAAKFLCCQSLYKYLPRNDDVYPRIAAEVPDSQFLFIRHSWAPEITDITQQRIKAAFKTAGLDASRHLVFLPPMNPAQYAGLNAAADVYLDSLEWSGGNTTLEAIAAGLPVVTLPGKLMRGRHSAAILQHLRIADTTARDKDDYIAIAVRLGRDPWLRRAMSDRIVARRVRLYGDETPVRALEMFIEKQVAAASPPDLTGENA